MKRLYKVAGISLLSLAVFWLPFFLGIDRFWGMDFGGKGMQTIVSNFDGLNFLVVAKSWYKPEIIDEINKSFLTNRDPIYFSAHYPGFALLISFFDLFTTGPYALLAAIIFSNIMLAGGLYYFFKEVFKNKKHAYYLSLLALFLPARMMSVRGVGSTEMMFMFFTLMSLTYYLKKKPWRSALMGAAAVLFRSPGILLFGAYAIAEYFKNKNVVKPLKELAPYILIPLTLVFVFLFYGSVYGSFWAYFQSGDNLHLFLPPFMVLTNTQAWVTGMFREDIVYIYLIFTIGIYLFWKKHKNNKDMLPVVWYGIIYTVIIMLVSHRDIARYSLPVAPVVLAGYGQYLVKGKYKWLIFIILIPVYLLGWNFVLGNVQEINDWASLI